MDEVECGVKWVGMRTLGSTLSLNKMNYAMQIRAFEVVNDTADFPFAIPLIGIIPIIAFSETLPIIIHVSQTLLGVRVAYLRVF
jgi:hypothetical protein